MRRVAVVGTASGCSLVLTDPTVSHHHFEITATETGHRIADLGSTNGVYVNGEKVARRQLAFGDVIRVGTTEILFKG